MIFLELFLTFLKIGAFTFGGGYAMLPLIQEEVALHGWLSEQQLLDFIAVSESTPGPFAINIATYIGTQTGGIFGAFCATMGVVLPSFVVILLVARFFAGFGNNKIVKGCMSGLRPAVIGLIASAVISAAATVFFPAGFDISRVLTLPFICSAVIFAVMTVLAVKKTNPILIIGISAACGLLLGAAQELLPVTLL